MQPSALAARELPDFLLLIGALEIEAAQIRARRHFEASDREQIESAAYVLEDGFLVLQRFAALIDQCEFYGRPDRNRTGIGLLFARNHAKECRLARTVRPDDADDGARRNAEVHAVHEQFVAVRFANVFEF